MKNKERKLNRSEIAYLLHALESLNSFESKEKLKIEISENTIVLKRCLITYIL